MESIRDHLPLNKLGIQESKKERCPVCNYGTRIIMTINGEEKQYCKYCEDKKLVEELNIPQNEKDKMESLKQSRANAFTSVPEELSDVMLRDYHTETETQEQAKERAKQFIWHFDKEHSLVLSGDPGVGKSHIAVSIAKALREYYSVLFIKSTEILSRIRDSYNGGKYSEQDIFQLCKDVDLLILDDMGAEYDKSSGNESWASDIIFRILDSRLNKSNVITTNYNESGLSEKFGLNGKRINSRMSDRAEKIRIQGKDWRKE